MLSLRLGYKIIYLAAGLTLCAAFAAFAADDGFGQAEKLEGKYFTVYYAPQLELSGLIRQLNLSPSEELLAGGTLKNQDAAKTDLAGALDTLFLRVCDILGMDLYSFQGAIKVCKDKEHIGRIYANIFGRALNALSFYAYNSNTIYISAENFKGEILAHEIAHAVMSRYFVVLPPEKIQEILAGYVEFQIRKTPQ